MLKQRQDSLKTHVRRLLDGTECIVCKKDGVHRRELECGRGQKLVGLRIGHRLQPFCGIW